jgi:tellurite resistance protein TerC
MLSLLAAAAPAATTNPVSLFPFGEYWWFYVGFAAFVLVLLAIDLGVFHRDAHSVSFREAAEWSVVWISLALAFNFFFYQFMLSRFATDPRLVDAGIDAAAQARQTAFEFLAGYVMEYSLSVDNIFVFVVVLNYFRIPALMQHRVLFFGILGALIFRAVFIALGAALMKFNLVIWVFGAFLGYTGFKMIFSDSDAPEPGDNAVVNTFKKHVPVTPMLHGQLFFVKQELAGVMRLHATPLFITLLFLELTDVVFAVDSVPAIFGLTREPLVVFTSNIFAILGLRNLYFMLAGAIDKFHMLKYGLGIVLIFVGLKMTVLGWLYGGHFPIEWSLAVIIGVIALAISLSLLFPKPPEPESDSR